MKEIICEGLKIFKRNVKIKISGFKSYSGTDVEISQQIIDSCYNRTMNISDVSNGCFNASSGNYQVFYSRDFGWCIESLLNLRYKKEVENTLKYALEKYSQNEGITVAINSMGKCFNFPNIYSPDSVAYLFRSLRISKSRNLIIKYKEFLGNELLKFEKNVLNSDGSIKNKQFSGMRDHTKNTQLCYDIIMCSMLCNEIDQINLMINKNEKTLNNNLKKYNLKSQLVKAYWNKNGYFNDSISDKYCSGHANVYPYFLNIITNKQMLRSSIKSIKENGLDVPIPLKYGYSKHTKFLWYDMFAHDWEKNTSWAMLGLAYIDVVSKVDKKLARMYLSQYTDRINEYKCFIELYNSNYPYNPYTSLFFSSDDSMLWASMYLNLKKKLK